MLATLSDLKAYLGVPSTADDVLLTRLLEAASDFFEGACGRKFAAVTVGEVQNGSGRDFIVPANYPVTSVTSVTIDGQTIDEAPDATSSGWVLVGSVVYLRGYRATKGVGNVAIEYTAGFETIPADVAQAVIELAGLKYRERLRIGTASQSLAGQNFTYLPDIIPLSVRSVIDAYRKPLF